jgi:hypothetical protein
MDLDSGGPSITDPPDPDPPDPDPHQNTDIKGGKDNKAEIISVTKFYFSMGTLMRCSLY